MRGHPNDAATPKVLLFLPGYGCATAETLVLSTQIKSFNKTEITSKGKTIYRVIEGHVAVHIFCLNLLLYFCY